MSSRNFFFVCGFSMSIIQLVFDCSILKNKGSNSNNSSVDNSRIQNQVEIDVKKDSNNNPYNLPEDF